MATKRPSRASPWPLVIGFMRWRTGFCATSISPRTRRSRRCSPSGATSRSSATRRASTPGRTGSSCAPATPRDAGSVIGRRTCACSPRMSRCRRMARARSSIETSSNVASDGSPSTIARWWSCTTTSTAARTGRRNARHPGRDGPISTSSRDARIARGARCRCPADCTGGGPMSTDRETPASSGRGWTRA